MYAWKVDGASFVNFFVVSACILLALFVGACVCVCVSQLADTSACRVVHRAAFDVASLVLDAGSRR